MANLIMIEFGGFGMLREIKFKEKYVKDPRRASIVIDEMNNVFWVWMGHTITHKTRNQLDPVLEKLQEGYETKDKNVIVGKSCQKSIIIDQRKLDDPTMNKNYQKLLSLFQYPIKEKGKFLVEIEASGQGPIISSFTTQDRAIAGVMIASILEEYPTIFIGKNSKNEYSIEADEPLFKFKVVNGQVQLLPGSQNLSTKIQNIFRELYNELS
ncbi:MAG: hypothetical protein GF329_11060 [Candidatus Lokiarchaeota archaeon]|nr:hypothetical protein [Candidatus Lokiarchaeota archaeon]